MSARTHRAERALPLARLHVHRPHLHAVAFGILHNGRRRVEAHGPGVEKGARKDLRIVVLHPRRRPGNEGKARGVALGKAILAKAADLVEDALGKVLGNALGQHPGDQFFLVLLDLPAPPPRRHVTAELIRLTRGVVGGHDGELHDLFLKQWNPQGLLQHRTEALVRIDHRLLATSARQIRVDHAAGDGTGAHNAHLDHQVVEAPRLEAREHGHLCATFDLEHAHRVGSGNATEDRGIVGGYGGHAQCRAVVFCQKPEGEVELGEGAEAQEVHLEEIHVFDVVLVPLADGSVRHGGVFHRHQVRHRIASQEEAAGMDREVAWKVQDLPDSIDEDLHPRICRIQTALGQGVTNGGAAPRAELGTAVESGLGKPQDLSHLTNGRLTPIAHDVGHHGGVGAAVLLVHVLDHLFPTVVLNVQIDVGRLGALLGEEALEEQIHSHGVDGGNPQAVAHRRVGGGAAALAENPLVPAELDDLVHGQEVAAVVEVVDDIELTLELSRHIVGYPSCVARPRPLPGKVAQPLPGAVTGGEGL